MVYRDCNKLTIFDLKIIKLTNRTNNFFIEKRKQLNYDAKWLLVMGLGFLQSHLYVKIVGLISK